MHFIVPQFYFRTVDFKDITQTGSGVFTRLTRGENPSSESGPKWSPLQIKLPHLPLLLGISVCTPSLFILLCVQEADQHGLRGQLIAHCLPVRFGDPRKEERSWEYFFL